MFREHCQSHESQAIFHPPNNEAMKTTKERLLSAWDYRLLSNPSLNDILLNLESGAINLDEALDHL